jgi:hypothetical protein
LLASFVGVQDKLVSGGWLDPNFRNEYLRTWSFNIEKGFPGRMVLDVGYQGSRKVHGPQSFNLNQSAIPSNRNLYSGFINLSGVMSSGDSRFDSLQVKLRKELSHGLLYTVNYTWSKTLDNTSSEPFGGPPDFYQRSLEWGPTVYSRRHVLASDFLSASLRPGPALDEECPPNRGRCPRRMAAHRHRYDSCRKSVDNFVERKSERPRTWPRCSSGSHRQWCLGGPDCVEMVRYGRLRYSSVYTHGERRTRRRHRPRLIGG